MQNGFTYYTDNNVDMSTFAVLNGGNTFIGHQSLLGGLGIFGSSPVTIQPQAPAAAPAPGVLYLQNDQSAVVSLLNSIRSTLISYGMMKA